MLVAVSASSFFPPKGVTKPGIDITAPVLFLLLHLFQRCSPCLRRCLLHLSKCYLGSLPSQLTVLSPCSEPCWHAVCMSHWRVWWYLCVHGFRALSKLPEHRVSCSVCPGVAVSTQYRLSCSTHLGGTVL